jgi:hypothetical protein
MRYRTMGLALCSAVLVACDSGGGTQEPPPSPAISVAAAASAVDVLPGGAATLNVSITRSGGYTGAVTVTGEGLPPNVTVAQTTIPSGSTAGTVTINAAAAATPGTSSITVRAAGTGVTAATTSFTLNVVQPPAIQVSLSAATVSVPQVGTANVTVNLTRQGGFAGAVAITVEGLPTGVTVPAGSIAAGASSAVLTFNAASAAVGTSNLTVRATATGVAAATAPLTLTITTVPVAPAVQIALNPAALSLAQGGSGNFTVTATRVGAFTGAITLAAENLPADITLANATVAEGATTAQMTVNVGTAATLATSNIIIRASGTGASEGTATLALTVVQPPGFTLALAPAALSVAQGQQAQATVTLTRVGGFAGPVDLTATGAPAGLTVSFNPASVANATSSVTVAASAAVAAGSYPITIQGAAPGAVSQTATLNVTVTGGSTGGGNIAYRFCETSDTGIPIWLAAQDGTGAWTRVTGNQNQEYSFQMNSTRGGIAYVTQEAGVFSLVVLYQSRAELQAQGAGSCAFGPDASRTVTVSVSNISVLEQAYIALGNAFTVVSGAAPVPTLVQGVATGPLDLVAARVGLQGSAFVLNRLSIQRGINPPANSTVNVDFAGAGSFEPASANATVHNLGGDQAFASVLYRTSGGTYATIMPAGGVGGATQQYRGVPANQQAAGELHQLSVTAAANLGGAVPPTSFRYGYVVFQTVTDRTITLGPELTAPTISTAAVQPYLRLRAVLPVQQEYDTWFMANFGQAAPSRNASVQMSAEYKGASGTATLEVPDLSAVAGWNNTWGLTAGVPTQWTVLGIRFSSGNAMEEWRDGATWAAAMRAGSITP